MMRWVYGIGSVGNAVVCGADIAQGRFGWAALALFFAFAGGWAFVVEANHDHR